MSTLIARHNSGDVAAVELDFVQVMSVLPNRKITVPGDAAVGIAFCDPLIRVDLLSGMKSESAQSLETSSHHYTGR